MLAETSIAAATDLLGTISEFSIRHDLGDCVVDIHERRVRYGTETAR